MSVPISSKFQKKIRRSALTPELFISVVIRAITTHLRILIVVDTFFTEHHCFDDFLDVLKRSPLLEDLTLCSSSGAPISAMINIKSENKKLQALATDFEPILKAN